MQTECLDGVQLRVSPLHFEFVSPGFPLSLLSLRSANLGQPKGAFEVSLPPALAEAPNSKGMRDGTIAQAFGQNHLGPSQFSELSQDNYFQ